MADTKISALTAATTPLAGTEVLPIVQSGATKKVSIADVTAGRSVSAASISASSTSAVAGSFSRTTSGTDAISFSGTSGMTGYLGSVSTTVWIGRGAGGTANLISFDASASNIYSPDQSKYIEVKNTGTSITGTLSTSDNIVQGTAAKGVNFTANTGAAGMTSQLLNWYEEGTWTPAYAPASGAFTSVTYNNTYTYGRYTRIGRVVTVQGIIITDGITVGTAAGSIRISGLPFGAAKDSAVCVGYSVGFNTNNPDGGYLTGTDMYLTYRTAANGASTSLNVADLDTGASFKNYIIFTSTYFV